MRTITPWLIIIAFIGIAVFGFAAMMPEKEHSHGGCIAALASGAAACPTSAPSNHDIEFHLSAFKSFSTAILTLANAAALLALALFVLWHRTLTPKSTALTSAYTPSFRIRLHEILRRAHAPILRFCALHERHDPSAAMGAG